MLYNYKVSNFKSFSEESLFSMKPGKVADRFESNIIPINSRLKVSKIAAIFGENAGGKTNYISSIFYLQKMIKDMEINKGLKSEFFYDVDKPIHFSIEIIINQYIYQYNLITHHHVNEETLYRRKVNTEFQEIFTFKVIEKSNKKHQAVLNLDDKFIGKNILANNFKEVLSKPEDNFQGHLFLNIFNTLGIDWAKDVYNWLTNVLEIEKPDWLSPTLKHDLEYTSNDHGYIDNGYKSNIDILQTPEYLEIFKLVDSSIQTVKIDKDKPYSDSVILREKNNKTMSKTIKDDSSGVFDFFTWSIMLWKVIYENKVIFIDEMDRVLNPVLSEKIVNLIKEKSLNGQLIFTTHNIFLMNTNIFMKEQLCFITKNNENLSSEIYSLADFSEYRYEKYDVYDLYLKGLLGGIPHE